MKAFHDIVNRVSHIEGKVVDGIRHLGEEMMQNLRASHVAEGVYTWAGQVAEKIRSGMWLNRPRVVAVAQAP